MTNDPLKSPRRKSRRWIVHLLLLLGIMVGLLLFPPTFRTITRLALELEAARHNGELTIGRVEGSLFAPVELVQLHFRHITAGGARTDLRLDRVTLQFAPRGLTSTNHSFFESIDLEGGRLAMDFVRQEDDESPAPWRSRLTAIPDRLSARDLDLIVTAGNTVVEVQDLMFGTELSTLTPFQAGAIEVRSPHFQKKLLKVAGQTDLRDDWLSIISLRLDEQVVVENASMQVKDLLRGRLDASFEITAFHGSIRGQFATRFDRRRAELNASGFFYTISVPELARFLGSKATTDGVIQEGKFSFHGDPLRPERATGSIRLQAGNFQWGERRWDSLVAAGTLVERRLEVSEFKLEQAGNSLEAKGEIRLASSFASWLESDFRLDLNARIADLGALSALFGPQAARWQGRLTAQGSVRGHDRNFDGQIIVEGAGLRYGDTPIDEFHAALRLNGNNLELTNFGFLRGDDYARGRGGMNILGARHYWGEIKFQMDDLAVYREFPAPPNLPWPLQGSARGQWSGDGSAAAHSGAIDLRLREMAKLGPDATPLDLDVTATYSPENIYVTHGRLGHGGLFLTSEINATPTQTEFRQFELKNGNQTRATGSLLLPIGFGWLRAGAPRTRPTGRIAADLKFDRFRLSEAWRLFGREPITRGEVSGKLAIEGPMDNFSAEGILKLSEGRIDETILGMETTGITAEATFHGHRVRLPQFTAQVLEGHVAGAGEVNINNLLNPSLRLGLTGRGTRLAEGEIEAAGDFAVTVTGLLSQAYVDGTVTLTRASMSVPGRSLALLQPGGPTAAGAPYALSLVPALNRTFLAEWQYDLAITSNGSLPLAKDTQVVPELHVQGQPGDLQLRGRVDFEAPGAIVAGGPTAKFSGSLYLLDQPVVVARALEKEQEWLLIGPLDQPGRIEVAEDSSGQPKVWPLPERVAPDPSLDSSFEMNLGTEPQTAEFPE